MSFTRELTISAHVADQRLINLSKSVCQNGRLHRRR